MGAADEGAVLHPGHVGRVAARQEAARAFHRIEFHQGTGGHELLGQALVLLGAAVAPVHAVTFGERGNLRHPLDEAGMPDVRGHVQAQPFHRGTVHGGSNHAEVRKRVTGIGRASRATLAPWRQGRGLSDHCNQPVTAWGRGLMQDPHASMQVAIRGGGAGDNP